ncbi:DASH complex subunit ASK1, partial [Lecanoromycetidae sp. Uapishka_2]
MSRPSVAAQRNLTLTEELEKLEQSITLTLQEIDHNFSRAHRIVTTSILPIVEQYAEHSKNVWEGSKFWKQFFEASANVSLSGYEEPPVDEETSTEDDLTTTGTPSTSTYTSTPPQLTPNNRPYTDEDSLSPSLSRTTPRQSKQKQPATIATYSSPYETLKRETLNPDHKDTSSSTLPSTPRAVNQIPGADDPQSSPFLPPSTSHHTVHRTPANDILLHRVLDKNWRLQATPHSTARLPQRSKSARERTPKPSTANRGRFRDDSDVESSPAIAAPQLHAEIFGTPARKARVPGLSVLTPARGRATSAIENSAKKASSQQLEGGWDSDEDEDGMGGEIGMSPPKTMQFHVPQGRLMRTPGGFPFSFCGYMMKAKGLRLTNAAREASKRIVEDLLLTAGGNVTDDLEEDSPTMVRRTGVEDEDTF